METSGELNSISKPFMNLTHDLISKWPGMGIMEQQQELYFKWEQWGQILNYMGGIAFWFHEVLDEYLWIFDCICGWKCESKMSCRRNFMC